MYGPEEEDICTFISIGEVAKSILERLKNAVV